MHKLIFTGNVGRIEGGKVELRRTPNDHTVCTISVAVNPPKGSEDGPTWYDCTFWDKQAEVAARYAEQGKPILVVGRPLKLRLWKTDAGEPRATQEVSVSEFEFTGEPPVNALLREAELLDQVEDISRGARPAGARPEGGK